MAPHPLSAAAALGVAVVAGWFATPAPAYAADVGCQGSGPCIVVKVFDETDTNVVAQHEFSAAELAGLPNVGTLSYAFRSGRASQPGDTASDVVPVKEVVAATPTPLASVHYVEVLDPRTTFASRLSHDDLTNPGGAFQGGLVPGFYQGSSASITYARPLRSDDDVNYRDHFQTDENGAIEVDVHTTGAILDVGVTAPAQSVMAGKPLSFTASVQPGEGTAPYTYDWDFALRDPDQPSSGRTLSHHWADPGTYYITVAVTDAATPHPNHGVANLAVTVTCNPETDADHCGKEPTHHHHHHPCTTQCPGTQQGGTNPSGTNDGHGHQPDGTNHDSPGADPQDSPGTHDGRDGPSPTDRPQGRHHDGLRPDGHKVSGRLLLAAQVSAVPQREQRASQIAGVRPPTPTRWSWPWRWAGVLVVPTLLGLGMACEGVQVRRRVAKMSA